MSRRAARIAFWLFNGVAAYTYVLYPVIAVVASLVRRRLAQPSMAEPPTVGVIVAARDEAAQIPALFAAFSRLEYPPWLLEVIIVLDHCVDGTAAAVERSRPLIEAAGQRLLVLRQDGALAGKGAALNLAVSACRADVLVFTDANVTLHPRAVLELSRWFALDGVGGVCGRRLAAPHGEEAPAAGDRLYWSYEAVLKQAEARLWSVAGADGALYALRRELYRPATGCADDFELSLGVVAQGSRLVYERNAVALEGSTPLLRDEFRRKVRTQACALPVLLRALAGSAPRRPLFAWILLSHKLLRYFVPASLVIAYLAGAASGPGLVRRAWQLQTAGVAGALGSGLSVRAGLAGPRLAAPFYALVGQAAIAVAPVRALRGLSGEWRRTPRAPRDVHPR